jgi:hypothetical protein
VGGPKGVGSERERLGSWRGKDFVGMRESNLSLSLSLSLSLARASADEGTENFWKNVFGEGGWGGGMFNSLDRSSSWGWIPTLNKLLRGTG